MSGKEQKMQLQNYRQFSMKDNDSTLQISELVSFIPKRFDNDR